MLATTPSRANRSTSPEDRGGVRLHHVVDVQLQRADPEPVVVELLRGASSTLETVRAILATMVAPPE
ncbi:hypothetical protein [Streptomyces fractus]|uniref:hypothetical protein n=1 Tax=Streptomyces fractus TaxID=641806 RepID=UPI003CF8AC14